MPVKVTDMGCCQIDERVYPAVGFGTFPLKDEACFKAVMQASEIGYRIIDTATYYENFIPIGNALKMFNREHFYIISKVWPDAQTSQKIQKDIEKTLIQLQTTYLDAYFLHWPNSKIPIEDTLGTMEKLRNSGHIRHVGLSNVNVNHLRRILELQIPIAWVQIEMHPHFYDPKLLQFCQEQRISVQAWRPLARGHLGEDPLLDALSKKYDKTIAQIALKWIVQHHCISLPGSKNLDHMRENFNIQNFMLSQEEIEAIDHKAKAGQRRRMTLADRCGFTDEFDFSYEECWPK